MRYLKYLLGGMLTAALVACGGGGGNPGTSSGSSGSGGSSGGTTSPTISLTLADSSGAALAVNAINKSANYYAKVVLKNAAGAVLPNQLVKLSTDYTVATLAGNSSDATSLTDGNGAVSVLIGPLTLTTTGAATLTASASVNGTTLTSSLNFSTSASNVSLANLTATPAAIGALETSAVTVVAGVNGSASSGVVVNFVASCGAFSPPSVTSTSNGLASSTYQSASGCGSSTVTVTASASGATPLSKTIPVSAARAANIVYTSATPALMYVSSAASGSKTSIVKFQVLDSAATGLASQSVKFNLSSASIASGVKFSLSGTTSTSEQTVTTDSSGYASIAVASGTLPTPVSLTAVLASDSTVTAASLGLVVTTGAATQNSASLSATKLSIEALNTDGVTSSLTMRIADRMGNPVPNGTPINFVASHGSVTGSCLTTTTNGSSGCTVTYTSQGSRPANGNGRVAILAYLDGEESFIDSISGTVNMWDAGETFYDVGTLYMDANENGVWDSGEQTFPGGSTGNVSCINPINTYPAIVGTCDGTWSSSIRVRQQTIITLATSAAVLTQEGGRSLTGFTVFIHDANGSANANGNNPSLNAMPTGTTVSASIATSGASCSVIAASPNVVVNSPSGGRHNIVLSGDADCATVTVNVSVTTPGGVTTTKAF